MQSAWGPVHEYSYLQRQKRMLDFRELELQAVGSHLRTWVLGPNRGSEHLLQVQQSLLTSEPSLQALRSRSMHVVKAPQGPLHLATSALFPVVSAELETEL